MAHYLLIGLALGAIPGAIVLVFLVRQSAIETGPPLSEPRERTELDERLLLDPDCWKRGYER
jgi:hypothetical protein